jgi:hypothetical protein
VLPPLLQPRAVELPVPPPPLLLRPLIAAPALDGRAPALEGRTRTNPVVLPSTPLPLPLPLPDCAVPHPPSPLLLLPLPSTAPAQAGSTRPLLPWPAADTGRAGSRLEGGAAHQGTL